METDFSGLVEKSLTVDNVFNLINKIENVTSSVDNNKNLIKWKSYVNQVVIQSENYFYKVYEETSYEMGPFCSIIRNFLAQEYSKLGLHWKIVSFQRERSIFDFEQRQKLELATPLDCSFTDLLISFSKILDRVEEALELKSILKQLKAHKCFNNVKDIKLFRNCVNKFEDYAVYNHQAILLDDADWFLAPVDSEGSLVRIPSDFSMPVQTSYGVFLFKISESHINSSTFCNQSLNCTDENTGYMWFLYDTGSDSKFNKKDKCHKIVNRSVDLGLKSKVSPIQRSFSDSDSKERLSDIEFVENIPSEDTFSVSNFEGEGFMACNDLNEEEMVLYSNNMGKKSFQWELWQCCNNLCPFCYLGVDNRHTDKARQLKSIKDLKEAIKTLDFNVYNNISLIGGEFFQVQLSDEEVKSSFFDLMHQIAKLYVNKKIGSIWITATLTLGDQADLYKTLDIFESEGVKPHPDYGASGLWICTSWDAEGRFKTEDRKKSWEHHMQNISAYYPWVKKNTTIILSQKLCEMYLKSEYDPKKFTGQFNTTLFYKQPGIFQIQGGTAGEEELMSYNETGCLDKGLLDLKKNTEKILGFRFYPDRKTFRQFLVKYAKEDSDSFDRLFNIKYRADELHRNFNDIDSEQAIIRDKNSNLEASAALESITNPNCKIREKKNKHIINYATYIDSNDCMICDRNQIYEAVNKGRA